MSRGHRVCLAVVLSKADTHAHAVTKQSTRLEETQGGTTNVATITSNTAGGCTHTLRECHDTAGRSLLKMARSGVGSASDAGNADWDRDRARRARSSSSSRRPGSRVGTGGARAQPLQGRQWAPTRTPCSQCWGGAGLGEWAWVWRWVGLGEPEEAPARGTPGHIGWIPQTKRQHAGVIHGSVVGSYVDSFCCYGLVYLLDSW